MANEQTDPPLYIPREDCYRRLDRERIHAIARASGFSTVCGSALVALCNSSSVAGEAVRGVVNLADELLAAHARQGERIADLEANYSNGKWGVPELGDGKPCILCKNVWVMKKGRALAGGFIEIHVNEDRDYTYEGTIRTEDGDEFEIDCDEAFSSESAALASAAATASSAGEGEATPPETEGGQEG